LVEELIDIRRKLDVISYLILIILYENIQDFKKKTFEKMSFGILYHLLLYLEEDISMIQNDFGIISYSD